MFRKILLFILLGILTPLGVGAVYLPIQGGTGTSTKPTTGQILIGDGTGLYTFIASSTLGQPSINNVGVSTNNFGAFYNSATTVTGTPALQLDSIGGLAFTNATGTNFGFTNATGTSVTSSYFFANTRIAIASTSPIGAFQVGNTLTVTNDSHTVLINTNTTTVYSNARFALDIVANDRFGVLRLEAGQPLIKWAGTEAGNGQNGPELYEGNAGGLVLNSDSNHTGFFITSAGSANFVNSPNTVMTIGPKSPSNALGKLHITGNGSVSTDNALYIENSGSVKLFTIDNTGGMFVFGTSTMATTTMTSVTMTNATSTNLFSTGLSFTNLSGTNVTSTNLSLSNLFVNTGSSTLATTTITDVNKLCIGTSCPYFLGYDTSLPTSTALFIGAPAWTNTTTGVIVLGGSTLYNTAALTNVRNGVNTSSVDVIIPSQSGTGSLSFAVGNTSTIINGANVSFSQFASFSAGLSINTSTQIGDLGIKTNQANAINVINGTNLNIFKLLSNSGHISTSGTPAVASPCGVGPVTRGTDWSGELTAGTGILATCTVTFNTAFTKKPICRITPETALASFSYTYTNSAITLAATSLTSGVVAWDCVADGD